MCRALGIIAVLMVSLIASAQSAGTVAQAPQWQQLDAMQQFILAPLSERWDSLPDLQRSRILDSARHYPKMTEVQKQRFVARLYKWSSLTPEQRNLARDNFREFQNLPRHEREAIISRWREQQAIAKKQQLDQEQSSQVVPEAEPSASSSDPVANDPQNEQAAPMAVGRGR